MCFYSDKIFVLILRMLFFFGGGDHNDVTVGIFIKALSLKDIPKTELVQTKT